MGILGVLLTTFIISSFNFYSSNGNDQIGDIKEKQSLSGTILDNNGEPLCGVTITIKKFGIKEMTDDQGSFFFEVEAEKHLSVRLMAQKERFATHRQDVTLGNVRLSFQMRRKP